MKTLRFSRITKNDVACMSNVPWRVTPDAVSVHPDANPVARDPYADLACPFKPTRQAEDASRIENAITTAMRAHVRAADALLRAGGEHALTEPAIRRSALGLTGTGTRGDPSGPAQLAVERSYTEPRRIRERASFRDPEASPKPWSPLVLVAIKAREHRARVRRGDRQLDGLVPVRVTATLHFVLA
jgi:hypothetical protein